jgi:signal peptidase I
VPDSIEIMKQAPTTPPEAAATAKCELAGEVLRSCGSLRFPSVGRSMLPAFWPSDTLVVDSVKPNQVCIGDVVVVSRRGSLCAHRVIACEGDSEHPPWITQGDALPAPDAPVFANELLGRVAYVIRAGRLIPVPAKLSGIQRVTAKIVRHSVPVARALVLMHKLLHISGSVVSKKAIPCQS